MFGTIKQAGLTAAEFAVLVGVKRVAVYNWVAGRSKPHAMVAGRVTLTLRALKKLVEMKKLPMKEGLDKEQRRARVLKLKEVLESASA